METAPLLFDLGRSGPTTRQLAATFKAGEPGDGQRRADAVYHEVTCRSALNRVNGMPFKGR